MFDNLQITKAFKLQDNITGNSVEICTFNATLNKESGIYQNMNINYPNLYNVHKEEILIAYRKFNAEVSALAITMGLAIEIEDSSTLEELKPIHDELLKTTTEIMNQVIDSLGDIRVNPVPTMDMGVNNRYF